MIDSAPICKADVKLAEIDVENDVISSNRCPDVMHESRFTHPGVRRHFLTRKVLSGMQDCNGGYLFKSETCS